MIIFTMNVVSELAAHAIPATLEISDDEIAQCMKLKLKHNGNAVDFSVNYDTVESMEPRTLKSYIKLLITGAKNKLLNM